MNYSNARKLRDVTIHGRNYSVTITKENREKIRKAARLTIVGAGIVSALMGAVIVGASLIAEGTAIPVMVCAGITVYTIRVIKRQ